MSEDIRENVQQVLTQIRTLQQKGSDLREEIREAKHNNQPENIENLKEQMKDNKDQVKDERDTIKDALSQIKQSNQTLREEPKPILIEEKATWGQFNELNQQRKEIYYQLKASRKDKNQPEIQKDLDTLIQIMQTEVTQKQQLLQEIQPGTEYF